MRAGAGDRLPARHLTKGRRLPGGSVGRESVKSLLFYNNQKPACLGTLARGPTTVARPPRRAAYLPVSNISLSASPRRWIPVRAAEEYDKRCVAGFGEQWGFLETDTTPHADRTGRKICLNFKCQIFHSVCGVFVFVFEYLRRGPGFCAGRS
jgi:hypothetical protein